MLTHTLPEVLTRAIADGTVSRIYHGKDDACRCGCKGRYYNRGDRGFHWVFREAITKARETLCEVNEAGGLTFINIPYGDNKAYTIYIEQ